MTAPIRCESGWRSPRRGPRGSRDDIRARWRRSAPDRASCPLECGTGLASAGISAWRPTRGRSRNHTTRKCPYSQGRPTTRHQGQECFSHRHLSGKTQELAIQRYKARCLNSRGRPSEAQGRRRPAGGFTAQEVTTDRLRVARGRLGHQDGRLGHVK